MYIINNDYEDEITIKNSRFITIIKKINNIGDVKKVMEEIKNKYPKATHYPYAYIIDSYQKSSDDGEPGGTAGLPILNVISSHNLVNILVVVVRYFGGIKLGTGGLQRGYTKLLKEMLKNVNLTELTPGKKVRLEFDYSEQNQIDYLLNDIDIINKIYEEKVVYTILISDENIKILHNYDYVVLENILVAK